MKCIAVFAYGEKPRVAELPIPKLKHG